MKKYFIRTIFIIPSILFLHCGYGQQKTRIGEEQIHLQRLQTLAEIWSQLYVFHPSVIINNLDFEEVLVKTIPAVEKAKSTPELIEIFNKNLFQPLQDSLAFCQLYTPFENAANNDEPEQMVAKVAEHLYVLNASNQVEYLNRNYLAGINDALKTISSADTLVVDLRWKDNTKLFFFENLPVSLLNFFPRNKLGTGYAVTRQRIGWNSGNDTWKISPFSMLLPIVEMKDQLIANGLKAESVVTVENPTVFLVNNTSYPVMCKTLDALQKQPNISVVWEKTGSLTKFPHVKNVYSEGIEVSLDLHQLVGSNGLMGVAPDAIFSRNIPKTDFSTIVKTAFLNKISSNKSKGKLFTEYMVIGKAPNVKQLLSRDEKMVAIIKMWAVMKYFYPHLQHATGWNNFLPYWLSQVSATTTMVEYLDVLRRAAATFHDNHITIRHNTIKIVEDFVPPLRVQKIQDKIVVVRIEDSALKKILRIGDEITVVDNQSITKIERFWRERASSSSAHAFFNQVWVRMLALQGKQNEPISLTFIQDGKIIKATLKRTMKVPDNPPNDQDNALYKRLRGNIGYVNYNEIPNIRVRDSVFSALFDTDGMIIDLRGYPRISLFPLASFLSSKPVERDRIYRRVVTTFQMAPCVGYLHHPLDPIAPDYTKQYTKPVVLLIDADMQSHPESAAMTLKNISSVTLVGSPTAGTTGSVADMQLPGGVTMTFTQDSVTHTDGSRFQNIGVLPDVHVEPTIRGIREGRNEILEKAVEVLRQKITKSKRKRNNKK